MNPHAQIQLQGRPWIKLAPGNSFRPRGAEQTTQTANVLSDHQAPGHPKPLLAGNSEALGQLPRGLGWSPPPL